MTSWQYFYVVDGAATESSAPRALGRTNVDGPAYNAQVLNRRAEWAPSEFLRRYHLLGSNEDDYVEIPVERAREIADAWTSSGRLPQRPGEP